MKKMNNILKMISQMDANANEIKLAKHEAQLGTVDDLNKLLSSDQGANYYSDYKVLVMKLIEESKKINYKIESEIKKITETSNEITKQAKELGLNANDIPAYKKASGAISSYKERIDAINGMIVNINKYGY
jgi:hypothetical protein